MHEFTPPGPGEWALDRSHYPGGTTPISEWLLSEGMRNGFVRVFAELGIPAECVAAEFVNGFMYTRLRPLIGADKPPRKPPPSPVLWLASRVHPTFRARTRQAEKTLADKPFREVIKQWEKELRPSLTKTNTQFQQTDVSELDDEALERHVADLLEHLRTNFELHFWLHGHDIGPIAKYVHDCLGWGLDPHEAIEALDGASPSTTQPMHTLRRLRAIVEESGTHVESLDDVRTLSPDAAMLLDDYMRERGHVLATGYDLTDSTLIEMPKTVLASIRTAKAETTSDFESRASALREQLPTDTRASFDESLADARHVMNMRDDNGPLTVEWPLGLLRRALLAAGQRFAERGALHDPHHIFDVNPDEARSLFSNPLPSADAMAARAETRNDLALIDPPPSLGAAEPEPPLDVLPVPLATLVSMVKVSMKYMGMDTAPGADPFAGAGIGTEPFRGVARVAASAGEALDALEPGDVLVVRATSPAFNSVLAIAGAIITADGGALSHAAVMARELGIPAVIGASGALDIPNGSTVEVDPVHGRIRVL